jgi:hypothetical protein
MTGGMILHLSDGTGVILSMAARTALTRTLVDQRACPTCHAAAGSLCVGEPGGGLAMTHEGRLAADGPELDLLVRSALQAQLKD